MGQKIKVSVIVPVYNVEKYLRKCLESLALQTLEDLEVIVVNDGSPDNSQMIIDEFAKKFPKRIIPVQKENGGLGDARNYGLKYAKGQYIGFVDSDDWVDPKMYESMYQMAVSEDYDIVICDIIEINDGWEQGHISKGYRGSNQNPTKEDFMMECMNPSHVWNRLYRKGLFYVIQYPAIWYEDIATTPVLMSYSEQIGYLPLPLYYYRQREGSIIKAKRDVRSLQVIDAWKNALRYTKEEYKKYVVAATYFSIVSFISFKPEFADEYLNFFKENCLLFKTNEYIKLKQQEEKNLLKKELIPKVIHYFWFGGNQKSDLIKRCIASWRKFAPDFEIIEWNESNCDIHECPYVEEAYQQKKWAFVSDYFRVKQIYKYGGIYLDTDMELTSSIDSLRLNNAFFAFETKHAVHAGIFGAIPNFSIMKDWLYSYQNNHFIMGNGSLNTSNTIVKRLTSILEDKYGIIMNGKTQILKNDVKIYSPNILTLDMYDGKNIAQHHYDASWWDVRVGITSYKFEVLKDYFSDGISNDNLMEIKLEEANKLIITLQNSTCWKITKPLRVVMDFLKQIMGR